MQPASLRTTVTLPADVLEQIDTDARGETRSRSQQIVHLIRIGLAGRAKLRELEAIGAAKQRQHRPDSTVVAREHLREHARLGGFAPPEEKSQ